MIKKVAALPIEDNKLLVVFKPSIGLYITLGGKQNSDETEIKCLEREIKEELPGTELIMALEYKKFRDKVVESNEPLLLKTYIVKLSYDELIPSREISEAIFLTKDNFKLYEEKCAYALRKKIIPSLIKDNYLVWR